MAGLGQGTPLVPPAIAATLEVVRVGGRALRGLSPIVRAVAAIVRSVDSTRR